MRNHHEHRQLAAIMFTDIVGYTSLMSENEADALRILKRSRRIVRRLARRFRGRWLETVGDGNLISFTSATNAVNCALAIQDRLQQDPHLRLRIGIHLGDVIDSGGHIYGDGVNAASRIHALAEPGGIAVSEPICDTVRNKAGVHVAQLGKQEIKGLSHPLQIYALSGEVMDISTLGPIDLPERRSRAVAYAIIAIIIASALFIVTLGHYRNAQADSLSIAVLPFENLSDDPSNSYFSYGISEELIHGLSTVSGLRVVGRTFAFAYAEKNYDLRQVGDTLNVSYVLEGSVRRSEDRVRISVALVEVDKGFQTWAKTYETGLDDIFQVQADISQSVVSALKLRLLSGDITQVGQMSTQNIEAYEQYLKARGTVRKTQQSIEAWEPYLIAKFILKDANSAEDYSESIALLDSALRVAPGFAEAQGAKCEALVGKYKNTQNQKLVPVALDKCNRALEMNPKLSYLNIAVGELYSIADQPELAEDAYNQALRTDPSSVEARIGLIKLFVAEGRLVKADTYYHETIELMPRNPQLAQTYGASLFAAGQYRKSVKILRRAVEIDPGDSKNLSMLAGALFYLGEFDEASQIFIKVINMDNSSYHYSYNNIGTVLFYAGDYRKSLEFFRKAVELTPDDARVVGGLADACRLAPDCKDSDKLYKRAVELTDEWLKTRPNDAVSIARKGVYTLFLGQVGKAISLAKQALSINPENKKVLVNAAIISSQAGMHQDTNEYLEALRASGYPEVLLKGHPDIVSTLGTEPQ